MEENFEELIGSFTDRQVGICDHFLSKDLALELRENLKALDRRNLMKPAGIGNQLIRDPAQKKRGDKICWIDNDSADSTERAFLTQIENFIRYLNKSCYEGINAYEFHYALYDSGSSYKRHIDQFQNNSDRKYSMIHYLNTDWLSENGGYLHIYHEGKTEIISPQIQKAVFFKSDVSEHEVCESFKPRMSISGWLKKI
jgi:SM-20-related protein